MDGHAQAPPATAALGRADVLVDLLLTVGNVDGALHPREQLFIRRYVESLVGQSEDLAGGGPDQRAWIRDAYQAHYDTLHVRLTRELAELRAAVEAHGPADLLVTALARRALATFASLSPVEQVIALELVQAMVHADGVVTWPEQALHGQLVGSLRLPDSAAPLVRSFTGGVAVPAKAGPLAVEAPQWNPLKATAHPLLEPLEQTYSPHPVELQSQLALDYQLVQHAIARWKERRGPGDRLLTGITDVDQIPAGAQFLDGHVHVLRPRRPVELVVIGDLHGCYACLKAALLQSDFVNRAWLHQWDPYHYPEVKLVLLGDYVDRGRFSFDGVLRAVLQLLVALPDDVFVLRGNHEYLLARGDLVFSGVHPAEGMSSLVPHAPRELLLAYKTLFEEMPTSLVFDRTLFVHGGIPRDDSTAAHYRDLSSLGDPELRFQMLWSDPVDADSVPVDLQRSSSRFTFGRQQFRSFMERTRLHTMVRGHEAIEPGFQVTYDLGDHALLTLFSAGGGDNRDLPAECPYRRVRPMALSILHDGHRVRAIPWPIEYQAFNYETHNGLYRPAPLLPYQYA